MGDQFYAGLCYASSVRVCDLLAAAQAFARVEPALRAVDLLARRKRNNKLQTDKGGTDGLVAQLSLEV